jgi:hypothetical protein
MVRHARRHLISGQAGKKRKVGVRKPMVAFRCPDDLLRYIEGHQNERVGRTDVILKLLQVAKDADETMGDAWWEVERRANVAGVLPGVILGRLALEALSVLKKK